MSSGVRGALAALALLAAPATLFAQLEPPRNWRWVTDTPAALVTGQELPDSSAWRFVAMPPGWHITMGPGGFLYDPAYTAAGRFALEAETFLFPEKTDQGFGILVGGRNLDAPEPEYVAFVIRPDGRGAVMRHAGGAVIPLAGWATGDSVKAQTSSPARNVLRVAVEPDSVFFWVNGGRIAALARSAAEFAGQFGFRVGAGVNLHISTLDFTQRIAPPRGAGGGR